MIKNTFHPGYIYILKELNSGLSYINNGIVHTLTFLFFIFSEILFFELHNILKGGIRLMIVRFQDFLPIFHVSHSYLQI